MISSAWDTAKGGRAASEAQQAQVLQYHRDGKSMRWIAESMSVSRRTVYTILDKADGADRSTVKRRVKLGLPTPPRPKRRKWTFSHLARQADTLMEVSRELIKEARGLAKR